MSSTGGGSAALPSRLFITMEGTSQSKQTTPFPAEMAGMALYFREDEGML
jgi:hypothetical protein